MVAGNENVQIVFCAYLQGSACMRLRIASPVMPPGPNADELFNLI